MSSKSQDCVSCNAKTTTCMSLPTQSGYNTHIANLETSDCCLEFASFHNLQRRKMFHDFWTARIAFARKPKPVCVSVAASALFASPSVNANTVIRCALLKGSTLSFAKPCARHKTHQVCSGLTRWFTPVTQFNGGPRPVSPAHSAVSVRRLD